MEAVIRVRSDNATGSVRFRGSLTLADGVSQTPDEWLGVEWDDPLRGKHDGVAYGRRYFQARSATGASFVRLTSAVIVPDPAVHTMSSEIRDKYTSKLSRAEIAHELVGVEKIEAKLERLELLKHVSLACSNVCSVGEGGLGHLQSLQSLDLSATLVSSWQVVAEAARSLPSLRVLVLSSNRFAPVDSLDSNAHDGSSCTETFPPIAHVQTLVLNNTKIQFEDALRLVTRLFPAVSELHLAHNEIASFRADSALLPADLRVLDLSDNAVSSVECLLPGLERLNLDRNPVAHIEPLLQKCSRLRFLGLGGTPLKDLEETLLLDSLSSCEEMHLPFRRQEVIPRLPQLKVLNGAVVRATERSDTEKLYLKAAILDAVQRPGASADAPVDALRFRQFERLAALYGDPRDVVLRQLALSSSSSLAFAPGIAGASVVSQSGTGMQQNMVVLRLRSMVPESSEMDVVSKKVPLSLTVAKLKLICKTAFKYSNGLETMELLMKADPKDPFPSRLEPAEDSLASFGMAGTDGCEIWMQQIDEDARLREKQAAKAKEAEAMRRQEEFVNSTISLQRGAVQQEKDAISRQQQQQQQQQL